MIIKRFLRHNIGVYECVVSNFAGKTSAKVFVDIQTDEDGTLKGKMKCLSPADEFAFQKKDAFWKNFIDYLLSFSEHIYVQTCKGIQ